MNAEQHGQYLPTIKVGAKTNDDKKTGNVGTIFLSEKVKPWTEWLGEMKPFFALDPIDPNNHESIAALYDTVEEYKELAKTSTTRRTKFLALVSVIQDKKEERAKQNYTEQDGIITPNGSITLMEGNNRKTSMENIMHLSEYNRIDGSVHPGSLDKPWLADSLGRTEHERCVIGKQLDKTKGSIEDWLEEKLNDEQSMYRKKIVAYVSHGVSEAEFQAKNISMDEVQMVCKMWSKSISEHKRNSATLSDTNRLVGRLNQYFDQLLRSDRDISVGYIPTFDRVAGVDGYVENDHRRLPSEECTAFTSDTFLNLVADPSEVTLQQAVTGLEVALMTRTVAEMDVFVRVDDKKGCGPFFMDDDCMVRVMGENRGKDQKGKKATVDGSQEVLLKNAPLGIEEWNLALMLCMVFPIVYRMHHQISYEDWENHESKETCKTELLFIIRTQIFTFTADTWGKTLTAKQAGYEPWKWASKETPLKPEKIYWAAAMMLSGMFVSLMYVRIDNPAVHPAHASDKTTSTRIRYGKAQKKIKMIKDAQMTKIRHLINAIESYQNDTDVRNEKDSAKYLVFILGK